MSLKSISCACRERPEVCTWYFSFCDRSLAPYLSRMVMAQIRRATRPSTEYSGSMPLEKKNDRLGANASTSMPAGEVGLDVGEPVSQREGELADGVRPGLGDVIARDGDGVEVADLLLDEPLLDVGHHPQAELGGEQAGVLPWSSLRMSACTVPLTVCSAVARTSAASSAVGSRPSRFAEVVQLLVDDGVEEERQHGRGGPLIVIDTDVDGLTRSKPS
jgi:hypothetical protein